MGVIREGSVVDENSILVGISHPLSKNEAKDGFQYRDGSMFMKRFEKGIIDKVYVEDIDNRKLVRIRVRKLKIPEVGDKFCSRHGQKGTIGLLIPQENMPVTSEGIAPDIIVNPHAIPSRMTIGQLVEVVLGKRGSIRGEQYAATAFENGDPRTLCTLLEQMGMESYGNEVLYNGRTGEQLRVNIFMGPTFY